MDRVYGNRKRAIYANLPDTVVEIGPGTGSNLRYYRPHTRVIAIEPNRAMHGLLSANAKRYQIDIQIKTYCGECIDLVDNSIETVIGTLVLCSVSNPEQVLREIKRILKPGGRYIFLEHVADLPDTTLRFYQEKFHRTWAWLFDGCRLTSHTDQAIYAAGFSNVEMDCFLMKYRWLPVAPHILGQAIN